jgi:lipopolysaccharide transport system ATP-binding protein
MELYEIKHRFEEIVRFSGIRKFLDTPVKYYSSGMYVRLGFSVAVYLDWDILLVDEVLAVGDADFQKKCIAKIEQSLGSEKSLILVSHNSEFIKSLCPKTVLLNKGRVEKQGRTESVINYYNAKHHV